jgi:hypothetical protein
VEQLVERVEAPSACSGVGEYFPDVLIPVAVASYNRHGQIEIAGVAGRRIEVTPKDRDLANGQKTAGIRVIRTRAVDDLHEVAPGRNPADGLAVTGLR